MSVHTQPHAGVTKIALVTNINDVFVVSPWLRTDVGGSNLALKEPICARLMRVSCFASASFTRV